MKSLRARSYAALTVNGGGSRPDSPLASQQQDGPSFLLSPPPPWPVVAPRGAGNAAARARTAVTTIAAVALIMLATVGLLVLVIRGGGGGAGGGAALTIKQSIEPQPLAWPPRLEADNTVAGKRGAAVDPALPPPPPPSRRHLKLLLVVHRHGARTPLVFAYDGTGNGTDAPVPYSGCLKQYPGVELGFRAPAPTPAAPRAPRGDKDPPLAPGQNVDESEPVMPGDGSCRLGTLTRRGYAQALRLGLWLRARYCRPDDGEGAAATAAQQRLACSSSSYSSWQLYSSRLRRTVATLRGVLTGLVADEQVTHDLLRALEEEEEEEAGGGNGGVGGNNTTTTTKLPTFTVDQCATHGAEFMYGKSTSCRALAPLVKAAEREALATDAKEEEAVAAARRACKEVLGFLGGCGGGGGIPDDSASPPLDWRRLRDVLTAMLAERGAKGGLELLPLPKAAGRRDNDADANDAANTSQPSKALLRSLGETMAYAARREARIIAPADPRDRTIALGIGPLVERIRRAVVEAAGADEAGGNDNEPRFVVYSGHDSTLMPLLTALGASEENAAWPPYASSLVFEVWGSGGEGEAEADGAAAKRKSEGRRERAGGGGGGGGHSDARHRHQPSADGSALPPDRPIVRVLHDGALFQERAADEFAAALEPWALDDAARAAECARGGGATG